MVAAFLAELRKRDIRVWTEGGQLRCSAPPGVLTPEVKDQLRERKSQILEFMRSAEAYAGQERAIVPLQARGRQAPIFAVGGHNGDVFCYRALARRLGDDQPFFGLQPPGLDGHREALSSVEQLAGYFTTQISRFWPAGPYVIAGYCAGGAIAFELAQQLRQQGAVVPFVALFACPYPAWFGARAQLRERLAYGVERIQWHARSLAVRSAADRRLYLAEVLQHWKPGRPVEPTGPTDPVLLRQAQLERVTRAAVGRYRPRAFPGRLCLFQPGQEWLSAAYARKRWRRVARNTEEYFGPEGGDRYGLLQEPYVGAIAALFRDCQARSPMALAS